MNPLMNFSEMTDTQLLDKMQTLTAQLGAASRTGMGTQLTDQIRSIMASVQDELICRAEVEAQRDAEPEPLAWDMESYLEANRVVEDEEDDTPRWASAAFDEFGDFGDE